MVSIAFYVEVFIQMFFEIHFFKGVMPNKINCLHQDTFQEMYFLKFKISINFNK